MWPFKKKELNRFFISARIYKSGTTEVISNIWGVFSLTHRSGVTKIFWGVVGEDEREIEGSFPDDLPKLIKESANAPEDCVVHIESLNRI